MIRKVSRNVMRKARHERVRAKVHGTSAVPRLNVFRSNSNIFAQIIDDEAGVTLVSASSLDKDLKLENGSNIEAATKVGEAIAEKAKKVKITLKSGKKALAKKKVTINVNGKSFSAKTNSKGVATILVKLTKRMSINPYLL